MKSNFHSAILEAIDSKEFYGELFVNEIPIGTTIAYKKNLEMIIQGLLPENPPHLILERDRVQISYDGEEFRILDNDSGFQIFRILDPRTILSNRFKPKLISENPDSMTIEYDCNRISEVLRFPYDLMEYLSENENAVRRCDVYFRNGELFAMKQYNIFPFRDVLLVRFLTKDT